MGYISLLTAVVINMLFTKSQRISTNFLQLKMLHWCPQGCAGYRRRAEAGASVQKRGVRSSWASEKPSAVAQVGAASQVLGRGLRSRRRDQALVSHHLPYPPRTQGRIKAKVIAYQLLTLDKPTFGFMWHPVLPKGLTQA